METISIDGKEYKIKRHPRRRTVSASIDLFGGICVSVPSDFKADLSLANIAAPLVRKLAERQKALPKPKAYEQDELFLFRGSAFPLKLSGETQTLEFKDGSFLLNEKKRENGCSLFESWYKRALYNDLGRILPRLCVRISARPAEIRIKTTLSMWGSCSRDKKITLATQLALAPPELLEYVLVHELCHLMFMDHSDKFWNEVKKYLPDYKQLRERLNENRYIYRWW